jgi:hypothetical protein
MKEWIAVLRAADAAARWHVHQRRKGAAEEPYINHLLEVASLVAEATQGRRPKVIIAALLHDAIEDQEVPRDLIAKEVGEDVAALVEEVTDDKALEKQERKRKAVETAPNKSDDAKRIKICAPSPSVLHLIGQSSGGLSISVGRKRLSRGCAEHRPLSSRNSTALWRKLNDPSTSQPERVRLLRYGWA